MSSTVEVKEKGWRPDPSGKYEWRYWDGGWTNRVANSAAPAAPSRNAPAPPEARVPTPSPAPAPGTLGAELPRSDSELAVLKAIEGGRSQTNGKPPGTGAPRSYFEPEVHQPSEPRTGLWAAVVRWCRSFVDQPESYHSPKAGVALEPRPSQKTFLTATPANYGRAGLVALASCGLGVGAYLPWISETIGGIPHEITGLQLGKSWTFTLFAAALALAAFLGVRLPLFRWVNMALAMIVAGLTARELIVIHDQIQAQNSKLLITADVGIGLWIMLVSAGGALIASFRIGPPE